MPAPITFVLSLIRQPAAAAQRVTAAIIVVACRQRSPCRSIYYYLPCLLSYADIFCRFLRHCCGPCCLLRLPLRQHTCQMPSRLFIVPSPVFPAISMPPQPYDAEPHAGVIIFLQFCLFFRCPRPAIIHADTLLYCRQVPPTTPSTP